MKKIKFNGKLNLNKTTVSQLNENEQNSIKGGTNAKRTATGPNVCTALPTFQCCAPERTATGPNVCTARPTLFCCGGKH